jgi:hypothetical protein
MGVAGAAWVFADAAAGAVDTEISARGFAAGCGGRESLVRAASFADAAAEPCADAALDDDELEDADPADDAEPDDARLKGAEVEDAEVGDAGVEGPEPEDAGLGDEEERVDTPAPLDASFAAAADEP